MDKLYYSSNPKFTLDSPSYTLYMCEGQRGRGKTSVWLSIFVKRAIETGKKFIYLRRSKVELDLALEKGLFNGARGVPAFTGFWQEYPTDDCGKGVIAVIDKDGTRHDVGYTLTLNKVKGISIEDADCVLFDEYIAAKRGEYKGGDYGANEPDIFFRLLDTIFRLRNFRAVLLGNSDTPSNPYNEYFRIPIGAKIHKDGARGLWYERDSSESAKEVFNKSCLGRLVQGKTYAAYHNGDCALNEVDKTLICRRPAHAKQLYNVKYIGKVYTVWIDGVTLYCDSGAKLTDGVQTISVTNADMSVDTNYYSYSAGFRFVLDDAHGSGRIRYDNQATAAAFAGIMKI